MSLLLVVSVNLPGCTPKPPTPGLFSTEVNPTAKSVIVADFERYVDQFTDSEPSAPSGQTGKPTSQDPGVVRIVGFDGVGWRVLNALLRKNELPNIQRLMNQGSAALFKTDYADSPVSWTTIAAGKTMEKHGIIPTCLSGRSAFEYKMEAVKTQRLWDILLYHKLPVSIGRYFFTPQECNEETTMAGQVEVFNRLLAQAGTNHFITMIEEPDRACHSHLLQFLLMETPWSEAVTIEPYWTPWLTYHANRLRDTLHLMDKTIGEVMTAFPNDTLLVVSDHGASVRRPHLELKLNYPVLFPFCRVTQTTEGQEVALESGVQLLVTVEAHSLQIARDRETGNRFCIEVLLPHVKVSDRQAVAHAEVTAALTAMSECKVTEFPLFVANPDGTRAINPDVVEGYLWERCHSRYLSEITVFGEHRAGDHGILLASGPTIQAGKIVEPCQLVDIVPTVLYLLGLPLGRDLDGKVIRDLILPEFSASHPVEYVDSYDSLITIAHTPEARKRLSEEQRAAYRKLGYPGLD